jgi:lysophospholipase L1-like esterase
MRELLANTTANNVKTDSAGRLVVIGASITKGLHDPSGGWVQRLSADYTERRIEEPETVQPTIFPSLGVLGSTLEDLIDRIETEVKPRLNAHEQTVLGISAGTNNTAIINSSPRTSPEEFASTYDKLLSKARRLTGLLMVVGLTPVDEDRTKPVGWDQTLSFTNERISIFDNIIADRCNAHGVSYINVLRPMLERGQDMFTPIDGLHPGPEGHSLIAKLVMPKFESLLNIDK